MSARSRVEPTGGVYDTQTDTLVLLQHPEWSQYVAWLEAGNDPDPAPQPLAPSLGERRAAALAKVNSLRDRAMGLGMTWNGHVWDSDTRSQANLSGVVSAVSVGVPLPEGFTWRTADNQDVPVTPAQLVEFGAHMMAFANAVYTRSWALKAEIAVASEPEAVDQLAGWPTPFPVSAPLGGMPPGTEPS